MSVQAIETVNKIVLRDASQIPHDHSRSLPPATRADILNRLPSQCHLLSHAAPEGMTAHPALYPGLFPPPDNRPPDAMRRYKPLLCARRLHRSEEIPGRQNQRS